MNHYLVKPGARAQLDRRDPADRKGLPSRKERGEKRLAELKERLAEFQEVLYAQRKHKILIVLQAMDTGGKDGTIRHVFQGVNPQGVRVVNFGKPTVEELARDYLWRVHQNVPGRGRIAVFNRSHYEDVLIVRVHNLVPKSVWSKRYDQINAFERMLTEEGTTILKFFLHVGFEEQRKRLQARLDNPTKRWKFSPDDLAERKKWKDYMEAYEEALSRTSTKWAPWVVVPADSKWRRNLIVCAAIVKALEGLKLRYPEPGFRPEEIRVD